MHVDMTFTTFIYSFIALFLGIVSGVGAPTLGACVFVFSAALLHFLGRRDLVQRVLLPTFAAVKALPYLLFPTIED